MPNSEEKSRYDQAIADYTKALELTPKDALAYYNQEVAYKGKGLFGQAIADHIRALEINPRLAEAYFNRGVTYYCKGDYDKAWNDIGCEQSKWELKYLFHDASTMEIYPGTAVSYAYDWGIHCVAARPPARIVRAACLVAQQHGFRKSDPLPIIGSPDAQNGLGFLEELDPQVPTGENRWHGTIERACWLMMGTGCLSLSPEKSTGHVKVAFILGDRHRVDAYFIGESP